MTARPLSNEEINYMLDDTRIENLKKELETYVKCLNENPHIMVNKTRISLNVWCADDGEVGDKIAKENVAWWYHQDTYEAVEKWLFSRKHKMSKGTGKGWCCGCFGSRWIDVELNGKQCRIAYLNVPPERVYDGKIYMLKIDPTL